MAAVFKARQWTMDETRTFIFILDSHRESFRKRKPGLFDDLSETMLHYGFYRSSRQCRKKLEFLRRRSKKDSSRGQDSLRIVFPGLLDVLDGLHPRSRAPDCLQRDGQSTLLTQETGLELSRRFLDFKPSTYYGHPNPDIVQNTYSAISRPQSLPLMTNNGNHCNSDSSMISPVSSTYEGSYEIRTPDMYSSEDSSTPWNENYMTDTENVQWTSDELLDGSPEFKDVNFEFLETSNDCSTSYSELESKLSVLESPYCSQIWSEPLLASFKKTSYVNTALQCGGCIFISK